MRMLKLLRLLRKLSPHRELVLLLHLLLNSKHCLRIPPWHWGVHHLRLLRRCGRSARHMILRREVLTLGVRLRSRALRLKHSRLSVHIVARELWVKHRGACCRTWNRDNSSCTI